MMGRRVREATGRGRASADYRGGGPRQRHGVRRDGLPGPARVYNRLPAGAHGRPPDTTMNKAFTRESEAGDDEDDVEAVSPLPVGARNYMTPGGFARLSGELERLVQKERPELVATVAWAAGNGDRSENGDYIYGKKRLREIDRRIRFLIKRLDAAEVVDPAAPRDDETAGQVFFGATVTVAQRATARSARWPSSASTRSTPRAATSAGCRRWRARCSRRAKATP